MRTQTFPARDLVTRALAVLVFAGALPGCALLEAFVKEAIKDPVVTIVGMKVKGLSLTTVNTAFDVEIENPNAVGLTLAGVEYKVFLDGEFFAEGASTDTVRLPAKDKSVTPFDVEFPLAKAGERFLSIIEKNEIPYAIDAVFLIGSRDLNLRLPAHFEGMLPLPKPPTVDIADFSFTDVSSSGVGVKVVASVNNPNTFDIPIDRFRFHVGLNGRDVVENKLTQGVVLAKGKDTEVPLTFSVGLDQIGLSVMSLMSNPTLSWAVELDLLSGETELPFKKTGSVKLAASDVEGLRTQRVAAADRPRSAPRE